jgi:hypothetical protein
VLSLIHSNLVKMNTDNTTNPSQPEHKPEAGSSSITPVLPVEIAWTEDRHEALSRDRSSPHGSRETTGSGSTKKIERIRHLAWMLLVVSEVVMITLISVQLGTFSSAMNQAAKDNALSELKFVQFNYNDKLDGMARGFRVIAQSNSITSILEGNGSFDEVQLLLTDEKKVRKIEVINIVDTSTRIVASTNSTLLGIQWDPNGLVSMVLTNCSRGQLKLSSFFTSDDVVQFGFSTLTNETDISQKARQSFEERDLPIGLIRYALTPIFASNNTCLGVIVSGDILTGKTRSLELSVGVLGNGFGAVYVTNSPRSTPVPAIQLLPMGGSDYRFNIQLDANDVQALSNTVLDPNWPNDGVAYKEISNTFGKFVVAAMRSPDARWDSSGPLITSPVIIVRGYPLDGVIQQISYVNAVTIALGAGFAVFDIFNTIISLRSFIDPLEKLVNFVRMKKFERYSGLIKTIRNSRLFFGRLAFFSFGAIGFLSATVYVDYTSLIANLYNLKSASVELSGVSYSFTRKVEHMVSFPEKSLFPTKVLELCCCWKC